MTIEPYFSIITITRNNLDGLRRTAASLGAQNMDDYEWIVIDGASTDGTADFMKNRTASFISEPDSGLYDAMNKGINRAKGTYLLFMNAGDSFAGSDTLARIHHTASKDNADFIYGDALETTANGALAYKAARAFEKHREGMLTHHQAMLYRRAAIGALRYDTRYRIAADFDFTLHILKPRKKIVQLSFPICVFESGGLSQRRSFTGRREQFIIRARHGYAWWKNIGVFMLQSCLWTLRCVAPRLYWAMKAPR